MKVLKRSYKRLGQEPTCAKLDVAEDPTGRDHALGVQGRRQPGPSGGLGCGTRVAVLLMKMSASLPFV